MLKKVIFIEFFLILSFQLNCISQVFSSKNDKEEEIEKLYVGGLLNVQIGTITNIEVSPYVGYYFLDPLSSGIGIAYQYYKNSIYQVKLSIKGVRMFSRVDLFSFLFMHGEYEILTYRTNIFSPIRQYENIINDNILLGIGYKQVSRFTRSITGMYILLLYNLNESIYTPYSNPVLRVGIDFGIKTKKNK